MIENKNLSKVETWFEYYKRIYNIFRQNILMDRTNNLSIQLSFFNSVPQEDDFSGKGQVVKLELFNNHSLIHGIMLKTTDSEEQLFQYVWLLVVNHFIDNNYGKDNKIKINDFKNSTRSFKYLLSDIKKNNEPIARANFTLTYNKQDYDEMLHYLVLNHNNYHNNTELIQNMRNYIIEYPLNNPSNELNSSFNQSRKVYEHLINSRNIA